VLTDFDLARAGEQCEANPAADPSFSRICDLTDLTGITVSDEALDGWVTDPGSNPPVPHAIICSAPPVLKRVLDYVSLSRKQFRQVSILPSYDKATEWLHQQEVGSKR